METRYAQSFMIAKRLMHGDHVTYREPYGGYF